MTTTVICLADVRPATRPAPPAPPRRLSWPELVEREPSLGQLEREMRAFRRTPLGDDFCANARWYGYGRFRGMGYRARVVALVGMCARSDDPALRTSSAYDTAYRRLYEALPDCRRCGCARPADYR